MYEVTNHRGLPAAVERAHDVAAGGRVEADRRGDERERRDEHECEHAIRHEPEGSAGALNGC